MLQKFLLCQGLKRTGCLQYNKMLRFLKALCNNELIIAQSYEKFQTIQKLRNVLATIAIQKMRSLPEGRSKNKVNILVYIILQFLIYHTQIFIAISKCDVFSEYLNSSNFLQLLP